MKTVLIIVMLTISVFSATLAQVSEINNPAKTQPTDIPVEKQRINFYVFNAPKTLDLFSRLVILRARRQAMSRKDKFIVVKARSSQEAAGKILSYLVQKKNTLIGTLWFDSHGRYANGYSSFILGKDEFSYKTINDSANHTRFIKLLAPYCDK